MSLISKLTPTNLNEEKEKFFNDENYNPQFLYKEVIPRETIFRYGKPKLQYQNLAQEIVDRAYYGRNEYDLLMMEGKQMKKEEVTKKTQQFLKMHGLSERYQISWSSSYVSRATIGKEVIKYRLPAFFRKEGLLGVLYHEVGTHAIRRVNYEQQPWFKRKKKHGFRNYLRTEEGLAVLHALIPHSFKMVYTAANRYLAVAHAQKHSFSQLWKFMGQYVQDPTTRWMVTFRQKRGLTDTSQPGGFTKDLVYFEGVVDVWKWLHQHNFDITHLYFGKMALEDTNKAVEMNPDFVPLLPSFFVIDKNKYAQELQTIGESNYLNLF